MNTNLEYKVVDFSNALEAIDVQRDIFEEDGLLNILDSLDYNLFISLTNLSYPDDHVKYYLAYLNNKPIAITGFYHYPDYPDDMWLAWFGVLPEYQGRGYGKEVLKWSMKKALSEGKKNLRLYTDETNMSTAVNLYKNFGFIGEKYIGEELDYDCYIYSKSLISDEVELWNNKFLGLANQSSFEREDDDFKEKIFNIYKEKYLK
ncbi:MAG: GNAT family N-acetyltransferase [Bacilli bacterium]|nr:GNAT family N-acetyltransferase [Bacilli bacterium]